jgi:hypothetical protein
MSGAVLTSMLRTGLDEAKIAETSKGEDAGLI